MASKILTLLCFLTLGLTYGTELTDPSKVCPPSDAIEPCTCTQDPKKSYNVLICVAINTAEVLDDVLLETEYYQFGGFTLYGSDINYLPVEIFDIKGLRAINIVQMSLFSLFDEMPPLNNTVEYLESAMTKHEGGLDWTYFSTLNNLKTVFFYISTGLKLDQSFALNMPTSLRKIRIMNCATRKIVDGAFARLDDLEEIIIQEEMVQELKRSMFSSPSKLHTFDFRKNRLTSIPEDLFHEMPDLRRIYLSENHLMALHERIYRNILPQLAIFDIGSNPIDCECDILWITQPGIHPVRMMGTCHEPANFTGMNIVDLTRRDFLECKAMVKQENATMSIGLKN